MEIDESLNVFDEPLQSCSEDPVAGFFRDGCCNTSNADSGSHTVCVKLTQVFLEYSRAQGNDLMTPMPQYNFPGLKDGGCWCLCAARWKEAHEAGCAPRVYLQSTHRRALELIPIETLRRYAVDLN